MANSVALTLGTTAPGRGAYLSQTVRFEPLRGRRPKAASYCCTEPENYFAKQQLSKYTYILYKYASTTVCEQTLTKA